MAVEVVQAALRTKRHKKYNYLPSYHSEIGLIANDKQIFLIRLPDSRVMKFIARSMLLALVILSLPWLGSILRKSSLNFRQAYLDADVADAFASDSMNVEVLPLLFHDMTNEGLLKVGEKAVFLSNGNEQAIYDSQVLSDNEMDMISISESNRQSSIPDETIDFVFSHGFHFAKEFIDRTLKVGGIVALELATDDSLMTFQKPSNYKIVYLRRFDSTIIAMKKISNPNHNNSPTKRRLCAFASEAKKAALNNLEDVLLEPPRASSGKSSRYLKRTKYLPDLLGDSLQSYPRRVFIDVGLPEREGGSGTGWFAKNYPTRNLHFDMYKIETLAEESSSKEVAQIGMSDWLGKNVKEEEYVVMKAEAEVVDEMVNSKAIRLVDELFLECKPRGLGGKGNKSKRAYWECLALYGKLRDEGVAVHQWWG